MLERKREEYIKLLQESVDKIVKELSGRVEKISLFGSYPERKDLFTDLDILVVMKSEKPFIDRTKEIYSLLHLPVDADILCYTPEELEKMKKGAFFNNVLQGEIVLYEKRTG